jgi:uncharacterized protein (TIGR02145 family)
MTLVMLFFMVKIFSQVSINADGSLPDSSAMLDLKSTSQGMLVPRMTQAEIEAIATPANGLIVYCTTDKKIYIYEVTTSHWKEVAYGPGTIAHGGGFSCGQTIMDSRDGKTYTTVQIGSQCWMAQNLNIGTKINDQEDQTDNGIIEKYCYYNGDGYCDVYGGLYQWNEMMQFVTTEGAQGICPAAWHLPSDSEWTELTTFLGGESVAGGKMKETGYAHWAEPNTDATNSSGFTALPGGHRHYPWDFMDLNVLGYFWSSTQGPLYRSLSFWDANVTRDYYWDSLGFSVRCLKDN